MDFIPSALNIKVRNVWIIKSSRGDIRTSRKVNRTANDQQIFNNAVPYFSLGKCMLNGFKINIIVKKLVKKFPVSYGTQTFLAVYTLIIYNKQILYIFDSDLNCSFLDSDYFLGYKFI
jgi:hypothetical protein